MTQEQKELLFKDLCARLPYEVKIEYNNSICEVLSIDKYNEELTIWKGTGYNMDVKLEKVKPYLFPLSSMTEEQKNYIRNRFCHEWESDEEVSDLWKHELEFGDTLEFIQWCYENHLDINSFVPKGLANDATGLNIYWL